MHKVFSTVAYKTSAQRTIVKFVHKLITSCRFYHLAFTEVTIKRSTIKLALTVINMGQLTMFVVLVLTWMSLVNIFSCSQSIYQRGRSELVCNDCDVNETSTNSALFHATSVVGCARICQHSKSCELYTATPLQWGHLGKGAGYLCKMLHSTISAISTLTVPRGGSQVYCKYQYDVCLFNM